MKKFPKITLPIGSEFVLTSEIPVFIADALYPDAKFFDLPVIDLYKIARKSSRPVNWINKINECGQLIRWPDVHAR